MTWGLKNKTTGVNPDSVLSLKNWNFSETDKKSSSELFFYTIQLNLNNISVDFCNFDYYYLQFIPEKIWVTSY
jgi:hypothetical protein